MPRTARTLSPSAMFHIIGRGNNGLSLFKSDEDSIRFIDILLKHTAIANIQIHHYVIMQNHFHIMAWINDATNLASTMKAMLISYFHYYRKRYPYKGHLWHSRYMSKHIESTAYMLQCGRYIELNPVHAKICSHPREYPWSSYHHYAQGVRDPLIRPTIYPNGMIAWKSGEENRQYEDFVLAGIDLDYHQLKKEFE